MKIYIICSVRNGTNKEVYEYVILKQREGHKVHFPPIDVDQTDDTGYEICKSHLQAMKDCDEVHVFWEEASYGSHFDLGMAFALGKPVFLKSKWNDIGGKSYKRVVQKLHEHFYPNTRQ